MKTAALAAIKPTVTTGNVRPGTLSRIGSSACAYRITRAITAFWVWSRFSAWSQTSDRGP